MNWQYRADGHTADAETRFCKFRVFVDTAHTFGMDSIRYIAHVETLYGTSLVSEDNIILMADACNWCESAYAALLRAELASVS